ncbi:UNVERIFIED_CONTAM: hypothetical protein Slati_1134200 [Sesamum latifolium]|uniref:HEPN domain-containing protein n=1 Tax=Sesamum latifolium TaxID=2727402 RepID=A0AAW2XF98_9LAMI
MSQGREDFLKSEEYHAAIAHACLQGARDFLRSAAFRTAVEIKAAHFVNEGFEKCKAQAIKLNGFVDGFDFSRLDASLDNDLEPYPEVPEAEAPTDEFEALIEEVEKLDD